MTRAAITNILRVISELPLTSRSILAALLPFLVRVSLSPAASMSTYALAVCLAPTVFSRADDGQHRHNAAETAEALRQNSDEVRCLQLLLTHGSNFRQGRARAQPPTLRRHTPQEAALFLAEHQGRNAVPCRAPNHHSRSQSLFFVAPNIGRVPALNEYLPAVFHPFTSMRVQFM